MARKKAKDGLTQKLVDASMREVFKNPPSTLGKNQTKEERHKQMIAIGLSKARSEGADVPPAPRKRGSRSAY